MSIDRTSPGFEEDIKTLFRPGDREAMMSMFDLWSYDDVSAQADPILERLRDGSMPCDGAWPQDKIETFQRWMDSGKPS